MSEPTRQALARLERAYREIDRVAFGLASAWLDDPTPERRRKIGPALRASFPHAWVVSITRDVAALEEAAHARRFWAALGRDLGVAFGANDAMDARPKAPIPRPKDPELVRAFARANAGRVTALRDGIEPGLGEAVALAREQGWSGERLARHLRGMWRDDGVPSRIPIAGGTRTVSAAAHSRFLAADMLGSLNSQLDHARYEDAGVKRARWRTQGDSHVRAEHRALEGREYRISTGVPGVGRPGEPPRCRCYSEPIVNREALRRGFVG